MLACGAEELPTFSWIAVHVLKVRVDADEDAAEEIKAGRETPRADALEENAEAVEADAAMVVKRVLENFIFVRWYLDRG